MNMFRKESVGAISTMVECRKVSHRTPPLSDRQRLIPVVVFFMVDRVKTVIEQSNDLRRCL